MNIPPTQSPKNYAIIGTGAIGGYYGARLQEFGHSVHFLLHSDYEHVRQHGLMVESIQGDLALPKINAYNDPRQMPPADVVIIALKSTQNHLLSKLLLTPSQDETVVLILQNGLDVEQSLPPFINPEQIIGGLCFICSNKDGPGHIRHLDYGQITLGAYGADKQPRGITPIMQALARDFEQSNIPVQLTEDLYMARWRKLVWNVPFNGLSVVLDTTTDQLLANQETRALVTTLMTEVVITANAWAEKLSPGQGRGIPTVFIKQMLEATEQMKPYRTSMKIDYDRGRPLEIEAILGNSVRAAQEVDVTTPYMTMLYQQLNFLEQQRQTEYQYSRQ